ncbi:sigma-70 family RNA polymerase sigma factor [Dyadobacter chenwenxiniae]|uniref:Sigma-70 family RNA polymerase sigma factor n=1 Tax=Dyadobacter chenwenxiniae TaxID=2906456 RepID=A0A9X1PKH9_9BACT|nr:sigma-70 family RNA polymerase sigma factor [Dyadobacter chenwenxiniae]MCF0050836.1 sigma-70 family RNA polymerase sigma factor [Dyadobacter chenwenxiniae]MCF0063002.1 sigma-70 family RNA polymerase sigma factor [Dyadobacter chenwenxiniae]UON84824.1 sigma-70 family RNA polymerase sigma factor [Dyadobacter chenwenxiniae]
MNVQLWQRFKAGDSAALGQLAQFHYRALYNYSTKFSADPDFIRDSIQELYLELWERREHLSETAFVKSYLMKALRHKLIKESIRLKRFQEPKEFFDLDQEDAPIETQIIADEKSNFQSSHLKSIITLLSKRQQEIIYLRFYQNLDHEDIANIMGLGRQSVSNLLHRTLKEIRQIWAPAEFMWALFLLSALS